MDTETKTTIKGGIAPKTVAIVTIKFVVAVIVGQMLGVLFGFLFDMLYIRVFNIYEVHPGTVVTVGIAIGYIFGWLGGLISHFLIGDYGAIGGITVGVVGATIPIIEILLTKIGELFPEF